MIRTLLSLDFLSSDETETPGVMLYKIPIGRAPKISTAMAVTFSMIILYFTVIVFDLLLENPICKAIVDRIKSKEDNKTIEKTRLMNRGMMAQCEQIPMLCILILFCRLRARVDLEGSQPQPYAQQAFIIAAVLIYLQVMMASVVSTHTQVLLCKQVATSLLKCIVLVNISTIIVSIITLKKGASD